MGTDCIWFGLVFGSETLDFLFRFFEFGSKLDPILGAIEGSDRTSDASCISRDAAVFGSAALSFLFRLFGAEDAFGTTFDAAKGFDEASDATCIPPSAAGFSSEASTFLFCCFWGGTKFCWFWIGPTRNAAEGSDGALGADFLFLFFEFGTKLEPALDASSGSNGASDSTCISRSAAGLGLETLILRFCFAEDTTFPFSFGTLDGIAYSFKKLTTHKMQYVVNTFCFECVKYAGQLQDARYNDA